MLADRNPIIAIDIIENRIHRLLLRVPLLQILTELYSRVKGARGRWRCAVLGALYGLVECASSKILLSVARVVLAVSSFSYFDWPPSQLPLHIQLISCLSGDTY